MEHRKQNLNTIAYKFYEILQRQRPKQERKRKKEKKKKSKQAYTDVRS